MVLETDKKMLLKNYSVTSIGGYAFAYCDSLTIYCEAESKLSSWCEYWNENNHPVVWGYKNQE